MKASGACSKCKSRDIVNNSKIRKYGHRAFLNPTIWFRLQVTNYICMGCGYMEEYVERDSFNNERRFEKLRKGWSGVTN